jgi:carbon-monoxide dehydrogenase large subunit
MPSGMRLDSGDYLDAYEEVLAATQAAASRTAPRDRGRIGAGVAPYVMASGIGPSEAVADSGLDHGSHETAHVRIADDGSVTVHVGTSAQGQGHATLLARVAADALGVSEETVRVIAGDTDQTPYSPVSAVGSRTAAIVADAVRAACAALIAGHDLAPGVSPGRDAVATVDPAATAFTYGVHGAVVEVDEDLGTVALRAYVALDDCGPRLQPAIVEGQLRGGIVQGIGSALLEELRYDAGGQPLDAGLRDYLLPDAATVPPIAFHQRVTPSPDLPGGAKGIGEAGVFGPPAAIAQAIDDALGRAAGTAMALPLTPERVAALTAEALAA